MWIFPRCHSSSKDSGKDRIELLLNSLSQQYKKNLSLSPIDPKHPRFGISKEIEDVIQELYSYGDIVFDSLYNRLYHLNIDSIIPKGISRKPFTNRDDGYRFYSDFYNRVDSQIGCYALLAAKYSKEMREKLLNYHGEDAIIKRAAIFYILDDELNGATEIASEASSQIDFRKDTRIEFTILLGLLEKSSPSEYNDLLLILKKCIDEREIFLMHNPEIENVPLSLDIAGVLFFDENHDPSTMPRNNYLGYRWTLNKTEPLLIHLLRYGCSHEVLKILGSKYHTPNLAKHQAMYLLQMERRYYAAKEQGVFHNKLFFPKKIDYSPGVSSPISKGGKKPNKGNVLIMIRFKNGEYSYEDIPKWFPANQYAVSTDDLSVIIVIEYSSEIEAYYSEGATATTNVVTIYAINAKEARAYAVFGPFYGSKPITPDKIELPKGSVGFSGGVVSVDEITNAINTILKGLL